MHTHMIGELRVNATYNYYSALVQSTALPKPRRGLKWGPCVPRGLVPKVPVGHVLPVGASLEKASRPLV